MQKLNRWHVLIIGVVLFAGIGAAAVFMMIKPKSEEIAKLEKDIDECEDVIKQRAQAEADLATYTAQVGEVRVKLDAFEERYVSIRYEQTTRPAEYATMLALWTEFRQRLGPAFQKFVPDVSGCEFTGVSLPDAPTQLAAIVKPTSGFLRIPQSGAITLGVSGRMEDIQKLLRSMHTFSRLITVGAPTISGTSPTLNASIPMAFYIIAEVPEGQLRGPTAADIAGTEGGGGGGVDSGEEEYYDEEEGSGSPEEGDSGDDDETPSAE